MVKRADQEAGTGAARGDESPGVTADEAERLAEQFTPMWEQEAPEAEDTAPAEAAKPAAPAGFERKKTMMGMGAYNAPEADASAEPPAQEAEPAAKADVPDSVTPPPKPGRADVPVGKKTVLGMAPPPPASTAEAVAADSEDIDVDIDTTEASAPPVTAGTEAASGAGPAQPQVARAEDQAAPARVASAEELAPTLKAPVPEALADAVPAYRPAPAKNRKVVIAIMGVAAAILLVVGVKALMGSGNKSDDDATRSDSVPATAAQPKPSEPAATEQAAKTTKPAATEQAAKTTKPAATEQPAATAQPATTAQPAASEQAANTAQPTATEQPTAAPPPKAKQAVAHHATHSVARKTTRHTTWHPAKTYRPAHNSSSGSIVRKTPF